MSYSREVIREAEAELYRRRQEAESRRAANRELAIAKIPEIPAIEHELAATAADVVKGLGAGKDSLKFIKELADFNLSLQEKIRSLLVKKGFPADFLDTKYTCPDCCDTGYISGEPCRCRGELIKELASKRLSADSSAQKYSFENFSLDYYPDTVDERYGVIPREKMAKIFRYCRNYALNFDKDADSLYFYGATGLGKTHLSLAIANVVTNAGYNVIYGSASDLLRRIEKEHFGKGAEYDGAMDEILGCDLLIIDDLGSEFSTSFTTSSVYNIINTRLNRSLPVIISTNLSSKELEEKYTQRVTSRIIGGYTAMLFMGSDIRQIK